MSPCVELDAEVVTSTTDALLLRIDGDNYWIPKRAIVEEVSEIQRNAESGDKGMVAIKENIAIDKGLV